jgi:hypothetical protein
MITQRDNNRKLPKPKEAYKYSGAGRPKIITKQNRLWAMVQVVECLLSKCEALSSNYRTSKKKKKTKEKGV